MLLACNWVAQDPLSLVGHKHRQVARFVHVDTCLSHELQTMLCMCCSSEQTFLDWYFRYDAINLPFTYHANAHQHPDLRTHGTVTGLQPILLHFADKKPWEIPEDDVLHRYAHPCNDTFPTQLVLPSSSHVYATSLARARLHNRRHHKRSANGRLMNR